MSTHKNTNRTAKHFATPASKHAAPSHARKPRSRAAFAVGAALVLALGGVGGAFFAANSANAAQAPKTMQTQATTSYSGKDAQLQDATVWTARSSADDAARAAGLDRFGAPELKAADFVFSNPSFFAAEKIAQAVYKTDSHTLTLRKAGNGATDSTAAVRTHDLGCKWDREVDDIQIIVCGNAEGEAITAEWADDDISYGVTLEGGKTMSDDDVESIVRAVRDANAAPQQEQESAQEQTQQPAQVQKQEQNTEEKSDVEYISSETAIANAVQAVNLGQPNASYAKLKSDESVYYVVTLEYNDGERIVAVNAITGGVINVSGDTATSKKVVNDSENNENEFYSNYISADAAVSAALRAASYPASDVASASAALDDSTGTPYYTVFITMNDGEVLTCTVDAYSSTVTS